MRCLAIGLLMMLPSTLALANEDYQAMALEAYRQAPQQIARYSDDAAQMSLQAGRSKSNQANAPIHQKAHATKEAASTQQGQSSQKTHANPSPAVLILISLSMPKESIISYLQEARTLHASVVMRGLVNQSFKETVQSINALVTAAGGGGIEINPQVFKALSIQAVPTVVVMADYGCINRGVCDANRDYDLIAGNIPIAAALKEIRDHGAVANDKASVALQRWEANPHV